MTLLLLPFSLAAVAHAQTAGYDPNSPPNEYRSVSNPYYWKNRMPHAAYWQQDVHYRMEAAIDEKTDVVTGEEWLTYWNNSPDTLYEVYFRLYQQAFVKGGHLENLNVNNNFKQKFGKYESAGLGTVIESLRVNAADLRMEDFRPGEEVELLYEQDFSVIRAKIHNGIRPGDSVRFHLRFKTYFDTGTQRRRMKMFSAYGFTQYNGVHWYPRLCVYDSYFGWDTDQHLGKEFYGNFGTYDVRLTFASNYIVGATGTLQNEKEVLPDSLRQKLDLSNFSTKPWESKPSVIVAYDSLQKKTWHFYAENVHDFAFTAHPSYRIGEVRTTVYDPVAKRNVEVLCQSLAQESHAIGWQDAADFTARCIEIYSRDFGAYAWPKIIVADARDGMEYPMLTLDGGRSPGYYDLLAHEVGHMWFMGQVGTNETYRAGLDEGFTQFIESWALRKIIGEWMPQGVYKSKYYEKFKEPLSVLDGEVYTAYMQDAAKGTDETVNQHSDGFNGALHHGGGYRHVYYKPAVMLYNLQYVMGDSLFLQAMKHYFYQWRMCHPYMGDFRNSIIQYSGVDLNWFFDQWFETTKTIDYNIKNVKALGNDEYKITFGRRGRSQMPLDFDVMASDGKNYSFHIPNNWYQKETTAAILPKWYGWDKLHPTYSCTVKIPSGIHDVVIDPSKRLADVYMTNNSLKRPVDVKFDSRVGNVADWKTYELNWRPDLWYNAVDGIKIGLHLNGDYFDLKNKFWFTAWFNTRILQYGIPYYEFYYDDDLLILPVSFHFNYATNTHRLLKNSSFDAGARVLDGLMAADGSFSVQLKGNNQLTVGQKFMYRPSTMSEYLLYPDWWDDGEINSVASLEFQHTYPYFKGTGNLRLILRSASIFMDNPFADFTLESVNRNKLGKFNFNSRLLARIGSDAPPAESALYLAGASPEELMENKFVRSKAFVPQDWLEGQNDIGHFQHGGGLNLRGYAGYNYSEVKDGENQSFVSGNSGAAVNLELEFDNLVSLKPKWTKNWLKFDTYLFADAGLIGYEIYQNDKPPYSFSKPLADAGAGVALSITRWGPLDKVKPLIIRADFPFFVSEPPASNAGVLDFRWVIAVGRAF